MLARSSSAQRLLPSELLTYERGQRREIELTRAALQLVRQSNTAAQYVVLQSAADPRNMRADAARALGLTSDEYLRVVRHVDSALAADANGTAASVQHLDSLRVALVVLRSRLAAEVSEPFNSAPVAPRSKP
jgi:hypothetical protein